METKTLLEKINFLLEKARTKKYDSTELNLIVNYSKETSDHARLGKVFGYSVSDFAIATMYWIGDDTMSELYKMAAQNLSEERKQTINQLINSKVYME